MPETNLFAGGKVRKRRVGKRYTFAASANLARRLEEINADSPA